MLKTTLAAGILIGATIGVPIGPANITAHAAPASQEDDPRWDCVWIRAVRPFMTPVTLEDCKVLPGLEKMVLVNNTRLSVQPVSPEEWEIVCQAGGVKL